jgi:5-formyltetrahydrofolate cyclo-ligase
MTKTADTDSPKARLREQALALRDALPAAERAAAAATIAARAFPVKVDPGMVVSGFSPMKTEINPIPLMRRLADAGAKLALPAIAGAGNPLTMRAWAFRRTFEFRPMGHSRALSGCARGRTRHSHCSASPPSIGWAIASATAPAITT